MKKNFRFSKIFLVISLLAVLVPVSTHAMGVVPSLKDILSGSKDGIIKLSEIPVVKNIALGPLAKLLDGAEIAGLKLIVNKEQQELTGTIELFKKFPKVDVSIKTVKGSVPGLSVYFGFPEGLDFVTFINEYAPEFKSFGLDSRAIQKIFPGIKVENVADLFTPLQLKSGGVLLSTVNYKDTEQKISVKQGINITATVEYGGFIKKALDTINDASHGYFKYEPTVAMVASITPTITGSQFNIAVGTGQTIGKWPGMSVPIIAFDDNILNIKLAKSGAPSIFVSSGIQITMPWHDPGTKKPQILDFIGSGDLTLDPTKGKFEIDFLGQMDGMFTMPGIPIGMGDVTIGLKFSPGAAETFGISGFEIGGINWFGDTLPEDKKWPKCGSQPRKCFVSKASVNIAATNPSIYFEGGFPYGINLKDLVDLEIHMIKEALKVADVKAPTKVFKDIMNNTPDIGISKAYIKFAPPGSEFAGKDVSGFEIFLGMDILGTQAEGKFTIDPSKSNTYKVTGELFMSDLDLKIIKLRGEGGKFVNEDGKEVTKKGPIVSFTLDPLGKDPFALEMSGDIDMQIPGLPASKVGQKFNGSISTKGIEVNAEMDVFEQVAMKMDFHFPDFKKPEDFTIAGSFDQTGDIAKALKTGGIALRQAFEKIEGPLKKERDNAKSRLDNAIAKCKGDAKSKSKKAEEDADALVSSVQELRPYSIDTLRGYIPKLEQQGVSKEDAQAAYLKLMGEQLTAYDATVLRKLDIQSLIPSAAIYYLNAQFMEESYFHDRLVKDNIPTVFFWYRFNKINYLSDQYMKEAALASKLLGEDRWKHVGDIIQLRTYWEDLSSKQAGTGYIYALNHQWDLKKKESGYSNLPSKPIREIPAPKNEAEAIVLLNNYINFLMDVYRWKQDPAIEKLNDEQLKGKVIDDFVNLPDKTWVTIRPVEQAPKEKDVGYDKWFPAYIHEQVGSVLNNEYGSTLDIHKVLNEAFGFDVVTKFIDAVKKKTGTQYLNQGKVDAVNEK